MRTMGMLSRVVGTVAVMLSTVAGSGHTQEPPPAPPRAIPGITAEDPFPQACVSCHVVLPDGMDVRLSTLLRHWSEGADSVLVRVAQSAAPSGVKLTGKHPAPPSGTMNIPADCLTCHNRESALAPPFTRLIHRIHLAGGETSLYVSMFQGECTYCHKLDLTSGAWSIPSGTEP